MHRSDLLIQKLKKQRDKLDELISKVSDAPHLNHVSLTYDATTRNIERNLLQIRKSFFQNKN